ncbi:hypothetical protein K466DRAFT_212281 [Polyporus arcularius HHB13444]|uniref:Uncharacterized protein n=1 Tax=Polyporus arcularius HHB13444 TaxID=1314778 RepID=A0A5C3PS67_9APHY|nr:hypothetical protein K466DRAFT_212281 [Polyporus arcularius HHB13444]
MYTRPLTYDSLSSTSDRRGPQNGDPATDPPALGPTSAANVVVRARSHRPEIPEHLPRAHTTMDEFQAKGSSSRNRKCIPKPPRVPGIIYDAGDGESSLQNLMGLTDDPVKFHSTLDTIRAVWRVQEVDYQLPYHLQDPAKMRSVEVEVLKRLPFLTSDYEDAWPVTFYLQKALKRHGYQSKRKRRNAGDENDDSSVPGGCQQSIIECIQRPSRIPQKHHDAGDGAPSLQSKMGLQGNPDKFRAFLGIIRKVWREQGIDYQLPYSLQDPAKMRSIKLEVIRRLPFLITDYEDAWPVTFYLHEAWKGSQSPSKRKRSGDADGEDDNDNHHDPPIQPRELPERTAHKKQIRVGRGTGETATAISNKTQATATLHRSMSERTAPLTSSRLPSTTHSTTATASTASTSSLRLVARVGSVSSGSTSPPSIISQRARQPTTFLTLASSLASQVKSTSSESGTSTTPSSVVPPRAREPRTIHPQAAPASQRLGQPEGTSGGNSTTVLSYLQSYHLPQADADHLVELLASMGVTDPSYLRVFSKMHGRDDWLREMRDKGEMTEIQMRILQEILVRM